MLLATVNPRLPLVHALPLRHGRRRWLLLAATLLLPLPAAGQAPDTISQGDWVRLHARTGGAVVQGRVVAVDAESLALVGKRAGDTLRLARSDFGEAFVSTGQRGRARRGALIGFLGAGTLGAVVTTAGMTGDNCGLVCVSAAEAILAGYGVVGGAGALVGALIGAVSREHVWAPVRSPAVPRMGLGRGGAVRVGVSLPL